MVRTAKSPSSTLPALSRAGSRFFAWWSRELAQLVPAGVRQWWRESDRLVLLSFDGARAVFARPASGRAEPIHAVEPGPGDASLRGANIGRELARAAGRKFRLLLCLPPEQVLRRRIALPLAVEENVRQALAFELDRYTPFRPEQVYFDCRVVERDAACKRLSVELAVVPRAVVDQAAAQVAALGLAVDGAVLADEVLQGGSHHDFLPLAAKKRQSPARLWWHVGMATVSMVLLAAFLVVPIWQKRVAAINLLEPLAKAGAAAQQADAARDHLQRLTEEHNFLHNRKWDSPSTLQVIEEISRLLPDDTFVIQFDFDGKVVQIQGETGSSTNLLEILEASPMFRDVGFRAQLTKIQGTTNDRFHITAPLEPDAKPKPPEAQPAGPGPAAAPTPPAASAATPNVTAAKPVSKP